MPTFRQGDAFWYSSVANNLAAGRWFENPFDGLPTADHPPLTVLVLGPASWLFDGSTYAQRMTMVVLGAATIALAGLAGRRLAGPTAGVAVAVAVAVAPSLWVNDVVIMSETLTALLVVLVLWVGIVLADRPTDRVAILAGALCGLAALARAEIALFLPLMVWPILVLNRDVDRRRQLLRMGMATVATVAVIAPWSLWNLGRFQEPVAISTNDGLTLLGANCDPTYFGPLKGAWTLDNCSLPILEDLDSRKPVDGPTEFDEPCADTNQLRPPCWDPSTKSKIMRGEALSYIRHHLGDVPGVVVARQGRVWGWYRLEQAANSGIAEGRLPAVTRWGFYTTWALSPVALLGLVVLRRRGTTIVPFVASWALVVVVVSGFYGLVRFRIPFDVSLCFLVGVVVAAIIEGGPRRLLSPSASDPDEP
ncbi:MAG: glycosyltransferase family 39 protein [Aquihabitans sp.]